ncbi:MAG: sigma-54 dependent transcriptional regulator [Acidobacteriota bacterium]
MSLPPATKLAPDFQARTDPAASPPRSARLLISLNDAEERERCIQVLSEAGYQVESDPGEGATPAALADLVLADCANLPRWQNRSGRKPDGNVALLVLADYPEVDATSLPYPYVLRPLKPRELLLQVGLVLQRLGLQALGAAELAGIRFRRKSDRLVGHSRLLTILYDRIALVARHDAPVLIVGESGTGKELVARAIHCSGPRAERPFVAINCGSIPEPLLEDELFGHVRGAFTDAQTGRPGLFEQANSGTVFLDEVTELSPSGQVKLLRVLQEREVRRVGGIQSIAVDVRVLAASNRNLQDALNEGSVREDLYYRLNVFTLSLPPLRDHPEDIPLLTVHFIARFSPESGRRVRGISPEAMRRLQGHRWPGNVRELENVLHQAVLLCERDEIQVSDLALAGPSEKQGLPTFREAKQRFERDYVRQVMELAAGNVTRAAILAAKDRKDFYDLMRRHDIRPASFRPHRGGS